MHSQSYGFKVPETHEDIELQNFKPVEVTPTRILADSDVGFFEDLAPSNLPRHQSNDFGAEMSHDSEPLLLEDDSSGQSLFTSEKMSLCQIILQPECAYGCLAELGCLGIVEFQDLNPGVNPFQRKFAGPVQSCTEIERSIQIVKTEVKSLGIKFDDPENPTRVPTHDELLKIGSLLDGIVEDLNQTNATLGELYKTSVELCELKETLRKIQRFFDEQDRLDFHASSSSTQVLSPDDMDLTSEGIMHLNIVAGVIGREQLHAFEKMIWRVCFGNVILKAFEIEDGVNSIKIPELEQKSVFICLFHGELLKPKIKKICEGFHASIYPCPEQVAERRELIVGVMKDLEDLNKVIRETNDHKMEILTGAAKMLNSWAFEIRKIKGIYHHLNFFNFDLSKECLVGECWLPTMDFSKVQAGLNRGALKSGSFLEPCLNKIPTDRTPPTFFRTNQFTSAFQELINAYGVASYGETNPAVFTIITFPFLFSVMFGDAGHGLLVFLFGVWMCINEGKLEKKKIQSEIWQIFFGGRYLITLMALFSIYAGLIYNDVFSKSINIYGSSWGASLSDKELLTTKSAMVNPAKKTDYFGTPYPFGVDPVWQMASNKIVFLNGFKMKISIIFGVSQMMFGVFLSLVNHIKMRKLSDIFALFIPQIIFLWCLFGYLSLLIFIKWSTYFANASPDNFILSERCAPSILITFINMVLFRANVANDKCDPYFFAGEKEFQHLLIIVALICVPWMLMTKPLIIRREHNKRLSQGEQLIETHIESEESQESGKQFDFAEIFILQCIHTIEFVLGSVSHTASYLRLWALSLAHAQLSEVLWNMVMRIGMSMTSYFGGILMFVIFAFWAALTVSILVMMEGLSAFLHTLRLHWVEFQSKFYHGEGRLFSPFSFKECLKESNE